MGTFRDASIGVWCISWHPASDDVRLEPLVAVLRNNRVAQAGQHKALLAVLGHEDGDMLGLCDVQGLEHHGMSPTQACAAYRDCWQGGLLPAFYPLCIESRERWHWMLSV